MSAISTFLLSNKNNLKLTALLGDIGQLKNGYAFQSQSYQQDGKYKILTIANVTGERYIDTENCATIDDLPTDMQSHQQLSENDILISLTGNVGRVSLCSEGNFLLNQRVGLFEVNENIYKEYIFQVLSNSCFTNNMIAQGQGAAQMNINKRDIENYKIPFTKNLNLILQIANTLNLYDRKIIVEERLFKLLQKQKQFLLREMFI